MDSGVGDAAAFEYLVFWFARVADEVGVERGNCTDVVELPLGIQVIGDTVARAQVQALSKNTTLECTRAIRLDA